MLRIGLTGGIACGKTLVRREFQRLGAPTLDSDDVARDIVAPGTPGLETIIKEFGASFLDDRGRLDRRKLAEVVFSAPAARKKLNAILHPLIWKEQKEWLEGLEACSDPPPFAIVDAALMIETGSHERYDRVIVVQCSEQQQIDRLMARDGMNPEAAMARVSSQMPVAEKVRLGDDIIDNSGSEDDTRRQVARLCKKLSRHVAKNPRSSRPFKK